ncbi:protein FAM13B isoform X1 [Esox lucius]|uniref:protein FAM13B isoform X1 n=1 Tax=Esox lucius TaxID=8010 RepID=UPI0014770169|nr:protein FAM13B isoform X1 [Esox lucius]XP_010897352.2 protein FAM13B isoform X1 [Esox lucius]
MRKSLSPSHSDSLTPARVFGVPLDEVQQSGQPGQEVPLLVRNIIEYIEEHGRLDLEGLFLVNGNAERVEWLRQRFDSGEEVDLEKEADLASAVSLLRLFLQELPEPIIPAGMQAHILQLYQGCCVSSSSCPLSADCHLALCCLDYGSEEELARNMKYFLQQLPQVNYSLLRFLCRFLSSVASLQEDSWSIGALAAVFGPDIFHLDTDVEDLKEQESVSRILAELLENQEEFFDSEDEDVSTTNDYSSNNEQITELLDDDKLEACEELPQDCEGKDGVPSSSKSPQPSDTQAQVTPSSSSHISPISILPGSAELIERTIRAAVEQHFFDLKSSIDQISSYDNQGPGPSERPVTELMPCQDHREETLCEGEGHATSPLAAKNAQQHSDNRPKAQQEVQDCDHGAALEESSGMDLEATEALVDAENNINTARKENQSCEKMDQAGLITCDVCPGDQNANTDSRGYASPPASCPGTNSSLHLSHVFPHSPWEAPSPNSLPLIDFTCMHLHGRGHDPVPAFKSWQDDSDSGEAQLSPLAGRMVPLPHEEDAHPLMARRFLDFGHSQRFLQLTDHDATSPTKAHQSLGRPRRASFSSKESGARNESVSHQLTKKLQNLKKKIKQFEEQFEKDRNYKPSHGDRAANPKVLKWMTDLTKIRKQLKGRQHLFPKGSLRHQAVLQSYRRQHPSSSAPNTPHFTLARPLTASRQAPYLYAKHKEAELTPQMRPRSNTLPKSFGSTLDQAGHKVVGEAKGHGPTREETLDLIQRRIKEKREEDNWPEDIKKMTKEQLSCEKTVLQKNLLHYEGLHGRPVTREERLGVKPLYDRYRLVKQMLTRVSITPIIASPSSKRRTQTLQPIIEGETAHFCDEIKEEEEEEEEEVGAEVEAGAEEEEEESHLEVQSMTSGMIMAGDQPQPSSQRDCDGLLKPCMEETSGKLALDLRLSSSNASSMPELLEQLWKARTDKKNLRKTIREFEDDFYQRNGRSVQKEDRLPMMEEYKEYKRIKAKLRLLEVLISKQDSSKSI